jgi:hypothetical protein
MGADRNTIGHGVIEIIQDLAIATPGFDGRSPEEKELAALNEAIAKLASGAVSEYRIGDRMMRYQDLSQLTQRQQYLRNRIAKIKNPGSIGRRNVGIRFCNE